MHRRNIGDDKMGVVALIMAGGKATRMKKTCEKPLIKVSQKTMIELVIEALRSSRSVDNIVVAVSKFTPKTAKLAHDLSIKTVKTPGRGYCTDMGYAIKKCALFSPVLVISADLPLITGELIDEIVAHYRQCKRPSLLVAVSVEDYKRLGSKQKYPFRAKNRWLAPIGISIVDGRYVGKSRMPQSVLVLDKTEQVLNVNTMSDLKVVEKLLAQRR